MRTIILGMTLLSLAACSTNRRLLAPDPEAKNISPEKPSRTVEKGVDPVCGASLNSADHAWHSAYLGTVYSFDSEECKRQFEDNPALYSADVR